MKIGRASLGCVLMVLLWTSGPAVPPAPHSPFVTVLFRNWTAWDRDQDGRLSPEEIDQAVLDAAVTGENAAAAGALKLVIRRKEAKDLALTREYFQEYDRQRVERKAALTQDDAESQTTDLLNPDNVDRRGPAGPPDWDLYLFAGKNRIARAAAGWTGRFNLDHMRQGPLSDCFLLSSLGSLLVHRPEQLKSLLAPLPDGTFQVSFPGQAPFIVRRPTDAELAISSVSADDGCWLPVMEKAFGQYRILKRGLGEDIETTDSISHGGRTGPTIELLTGNRHKSILVAPSVERRQAEAGKVLPQLRAELLDAIRDHRVMTVSVMAHAVDAAGRITEGTDRGTAPRIPPGITRHHAYAIISYDAASDMIGLWNPHGQNFGPKGTPGLEHGYRTEHGRFALPLEEAYRFCTNFTFEVPKPVPKKVHR